jgi:hypothetical protein
LTQLCLPRAQPGSALLIGVLFAFMLFVQGLHPDVLLALYAGFHSSPFVLTRWGEGNHPTFGADGNMTGTVHCTHGCALRYSAIARLTA